MNDNEIPIDAPLLACYRKKSWSVLKKVVLYGSCIIDVCAVIAAIGYTVYLNLAALTSDGAAILNELQGIVNTIGSGIAAIISVLSIIPWWAYAIILVLLLVLVVYPLLWCIAQRLTEEDWKSKKANASASAFAFAALAFTALAFAFAFAFAFALAFAFAFAFTALAFASAFAVDPVDHITIWYYIFRFIGAYLNYRERMKAIQKEVN